VLTDVITTKPLKRHFLPVEQQLRNRAQAYKTSIVPPTHFEKFKQFVEEIRLYAGEHIKFTQILAPIFYYSTDQGAPR